MGGQTTSAWRSPEGVKRLVSVISTERFATYLSAASGDARDALRLYTFNVAASSAFLGPLQTLEVALRNALHERLSQQWGRPDWWDAEGLDLVHLHRTMVREAQARCRHGEISPGKIIAELPFGFWVGLLGRGGHHRYEMRLWWPSLRRAFPHFGGGRKQLHHDLDYLRTLRNRIAHHEPIFRRHLEADALGIERLVAYICPVTAEWLRDHSRIREVLRARRDLAAPATF